MLSEKKLKVTITYFRIFTYGKTEKQRNWKFKTSLGVRNKVKRLMIVIAFQNVYLTSNFSISQLFLKKEWVFVTYFLSNLSNVL